MEVLSYINRKFIQDEIYLYHILVNTIEFINRDENDELSMAFYVDKCKKGFNSNCDVIKLKSLKIIIHYLKLYHIDALEFSENVFKLAKSFNWEILSLVLIFCSDFLKLLNETKKEKDQFEIDNNIKKEVVIEEKDESLEKTEKEKTEKEKEKEKEKPKEKGKNEKESKADKERAEKERIEKERLEKERIEKEKEKERLEKERIEKEQQALDPAVKQHLDMYNEYISKIEKYEVKFLSIINNIFEINSPNMTIKIGNYLMI